jgi:hypothetical protein
VSRTGLLLALSVELAGCARTPAPAVPLPLFPMALVVAGPRQSSERIGELLPDGSIVTKWEGTIAHLSSDRVVGVDGRTRLVVTASGDVWLDPKLPPMHFDARGALVAPTGEMVYVDDKGTPTWSAQRGELPALSSAHFTPYSPDARRTAEVLFAILLEAAGSGGVEGR